MSRKDDLDCMYRRWSRQRFPSGGTEADSGNLRLDLLVIHEGLKDFVTSAVLGGRPYRVNASSAELQEVLTDLEATRERALRMRDTKQGEARAVVENVLECNELTLRMYRGFLDRLGTDPTASKSARVLWAFERQVVRFDEKLWLFWLAHFRGKWAPQSNRRAS